jgi:hypothetical protein
MDDEGAPPDCVLREDLRDRPRWMPRWATSGSTRYGSRISPMLALYGGRE